MSKTGGSVAGNFIWRLLERCGAQGVTLVVTILLARLLDPEVYATVALVTIITDILSVFITSGLNDALVQKKEVDDLDLSTVFFFNLAVCLLLYGLMYAAAPFIAAYYEKPELTALTRALSLILVCGGVKNIQCAYVSRTMQFRRFFFSTLTGTLAAAAVGIYMAYAGYGVWALVVQNLVNATLDMTILWLTVRFRPRLMFSFARLRTLFSYAWKLLVSALLDTAYNRLSQFIIGKRYPDNQLAYYNKGYTFPSMTLNNVNAATASVLLPVLSQAQEDPALLREQNRRAVRIGSFAVMPMMAGLAGVGTPLIRLLLTEKWLPCVPFLRVFCAAYAFYTIHTANVHAIKATGHSEDILVLEIVKKAIGITLILITTRIGPLAMACSLLAQSVLELFVNGVSCRRLFGYTLGMLLRDIAPQLLLSLAMGAGVYLLGNLGLPDFLTLLLQVPAGALFYVAGARLLKLEAFDYLLGLLRGRLKHKTAEEG